MVEGGRQTTYQFFKPMFKGVLIELDLQSKTDSPFELLNNGKHTLEVRLYGYPEDKFPDIPFDITSFAPSRCKKKWIGIFENDFNDRTQLEFSLTTPGSSDKPIRRTQPLTTRTPGQIKDVHLDDIFEFTVAITMKTDIDMKIREDLDLCPREAAFFKNRKDFVFKKMETKFTKNVISRLEDVPHIAVIGSGGGMRAVVGLGAALAALENLQILDLSMYTAGLSGSAWYLLTLYASDERFEPTKVNDHIRHKLKNNYGMYFKMAWTILTYPVRRLKHNINFSITNLFGEMIGYLLLGEICNDKWSKQAARFENGDIPLPLIAAVHVHPERTLTTFNEWIELSPYEVLLPGYGVAIDMTEFGSQFYSGFFIKKTQELPIHFLHGICGSAFAAGREYRPQELIDFGNMDRFLGSYFFRNRIWSLFNRFDFHVVAKVPNCLHGISKIENLPRKQDKKRKKGDDSTSSGSKGGVWYIFWSVVMAGIWKGLTYSVGRIINILGYFFESRYSRLHVPMNDDPTMMLVDAGIDFNSPYPTVLHPSRQIDIIISFDFSDRYLDKNLPFEELKKAAQWADERGVSFPKLYPHLQIWENAWKKGTREEMYVFPGSPTIVHFVLINKSFRQTDMQGVDFDIFPRYGTLKFSYSNIDFDRLNKLVQHNIQINEKAILDCIREKIQEKKANQL